MSRPPRSQRLVEKAEGALIAAIEVYNKPGASYREETFAILMLNAWELLVKARLVQKHSNDIRSLYVYEPARRKDNSIGKRLVLKKNRTGNAHTKGLQAVIKELNTFKDSRLEGQIAENIEAITIIRDNAVHYLNTSSALKERVFEIGIASVRNFLMLSARWFDTNLDRYDLALLPIGYLRAPAKASGVIASKDEKALLDYLGQLSSKDDGSGEFRFSISVAVELKGSRSAALGAPQMVLGRQGDPNATSIVLTEEDLSSEYPWDYKELCLRLQARYSDFKQNDVFHKTRAKICTMPGMMFDRFLDNRSKSGTKKSFYSPSILNEFDKHYTRQAAMT